MNLYKTFYSIAISGTEQVYTLSDPYFLSGATFIAGTGATIGTILIESALPITEESTGLYYATINDSLYANDMNYDLVWYVQHTSSAPIKKLYTRFRKERQTNISTLLEVELIDNSISIEINNNSQEIEIN